MSAATRYLLLVPLLCILFYSAARSLAPQLLTPNNELAGAIGAIIIAFLIAKSRSNNATETDIPISKGGKPGRDLEQWVGEVLKQQGWQLSHMPKSRDRGADVFAIKGSKKLLVQCKDYTGAVGFNAVKDVYAAGAHYPNDYLCVVARNGFSTDAKDAATRMNVKLVIAEDFPLYARKLH